VPGTYFGTYFGPAPPGQAPRAQLQLGIRILEEGHAIRQEVYQRERRHRAELLALEAQMQAKLEALTRINEDLTQRLEEAAALLRRRPKERPWSSSPTERVQSPPAEVDEAAQVP
jgi:hypothetical protein